MSKLNFIINYVADAPKSAELYAKLLGVQPVESSPGWAMFVLPTGIILGLWARHEVEPKPEGHGGTELCIEVDGDADVPTTLAAWQGYGVAIIQQTTIMDFGLTFAAQDPDGNRLRVFASNRR